MKISPWAALAVALSPVLFSVSALAEGRFISVGTTSKGYQMLVDRQSIGGTGSFDIDVPLPSGGMETWSMQAGCSERHLQIVEVTTYSANGQELSRSGGAGEISAYNANTVGGKTLQVVCRAMGVRGF